MDPIALSAAGTLLAGVAAAALVLPKVARRMRPEAPDERPVLTEADLDRIEAAMEETRLPLCRLEPLAGAVEASGSRLGGAPWAPSAAEPWPQDAQGRPMVFLAQVNFAATPGLEGFPEGGLLQLFVPASARGEAAALSGSGPEARVLRWFETPRGGTVQPVPEALTGRRSRSPLRGAARDGGVALRAEPDRLPPMDCVPSMEALTQEVARGRTAAPATKLRVDRWWEGQDDIEERYGTHWVGGHPGFLGEDPRGETAPADLDRVLLHLGTDENVELPGLGELNLLIRREDLARRRFDRAWLGWERA